MKRITVEDFSKNLLNEQLNVVNSFISNEKIKDFSVDPTSKSTEIKHLKENLRTE